MNKPGIITEVQIKTDCESADCIEKNCTINFEICQGKNCCPKKITMMNFTRCKVQNFSECNDFGINLAFGIKVNVLKVGTNSWLGNYIIVTTKANGTNAPMAAKATNNKKDSYYDCSINQDHILSSTRISVDHNCPLKEGKYKLAFMI